jgi:O-acetylserine/cysteine efflux transporter
MFLGLPAGLTSIVIQIQAAFTVLVAALVLREVPRRRQTCSASLVGLSGLALIGAQSAGGRCPFSAFVVALAAALSWAIGNVIARGVKRGDQLACR